MGSNINPLKFGGNKPMEMDLTKFKKKRIYQMVSQGELTDQMIRLQKREEELKKYKYWQDFDRASTQLDNSFCTWHEAKQKMVVNSLIFGTFLTRMYLWNILFNHMTYGIYKRYGIPICFALCFTLYIYGKGTTLSHVINNQYFREIKPEEKYHRALDQQMDLYQYVDDIKYNFDYSQSDIRQSQRIYKRQYAKQMKKKIDEKFGIINQQNVKLKP